MITFRLSLLVIIIVANGVICDDIRNTTNAVLPEAKNAFKFEDQDQGDTPQSYGLIRFEGQGDGLQYSDPQYAPDNEAQRIKFQDDNTIENQRPIQQKKKRRRRKPRQRFPNQGGGFQNGGIPGYPTIPSPVLPGPSYPGPRPYPQVGYPGPFYKPRPSAAETALSAVTDALSSIAQYDDRQCVARLLCEAAGGAGGAGGGAGSGAGGAGGLLKAITGLQPLLTLLAAYNGISSSPLFVFGRAVFLGMTSRATPGTCRYAYPDCPTDPEQLVHYLNNHNGGFFRFFAAPQNQQQNLEQFYNQLSGQNYGYYDPQQNLQQNGYGQLHPNLQQIDYGPQPYLNTNLQQQDLYQNQYGGYGQYPQHQNYQHLQNNGYQRPGVYNGYGFYGQQYPYQHNSNYRFKSNKIEKRIQNIRNTEVINDDSGNGNAKWIFPDKTKFNNKDFENVRQGKVLKFPQSNVNSDKAAKGFVFPGSQSNRDYILSNIEAVDDNDSVFDGPSTMNDFRFQNQYNYKVQYNHGNDEDDMNENGVRVLYIVRGNGDPNNPEVVRLTPGQTL